MPTPEQNIALKNGLSVFLADDPSDYTTPLASPEDAVARGILDETGQATDKGVLFSQLKQYGIFDSRGALTDKGKAYAMDYDDVLDDPETMWAYQLRSQDGIDSPPSDQGIIAPIVESFWDAGAGAVTQIKNTAKDVAKDAFGIGSGANQAEAQAGNTAMVEGAIKANQQLTGLLGVGIAHLVDPVMNAMGEEKDAQVWQARRERDRIKRDAARAKDGQTLEDLELSATAIEDMAAAKAAMGDEAYAKTVKQGGALGENVFDVPNAFGVVGGVLGGTKGVGIVTRQALKKERLAFELAEVNSQMATESLKLAEAAKARHLAETTAQAARNAEARLSERALATGDMKWGDGARQSAEIAAKHEAVIPRLASEVEESTAKLAALQEQVAALPEFAQSTLAKWTELGRAAGPTVQGVGNLTESAGDLLSTANKSFSEMDKATGFSKALGLLRPAASAVGFGAGGVPGLAITESVMRSGPMVSGIGKVMRNVGKEMMRARGQVPFWQRVANYSDMGPAHRALAHTVDTMTAGGAIPGAARRVAAGTLAAYPADLLFEYLQDDQAPAGETFKRALGGALVLGGSSAALGGVFLGSKERHKQLALGDQRNFMEDLRRTGDTNQMARFNAIPQGIQRSIGTYAAANPNLRWNFKVDGDSRYDGKTNTVEINIAGDTPLKALVAHEINHNLLVRNNMEDGVIATLVGDGEVGGILRSKDGTLDPEFQSFMDGYNNRLELQGDSPIGVREAAKEFFVDTAADMMGEAAESGKLGQMAGKTNLRRTIESLLPKAPILRDLHMKLGGLFEADTGRMVVGNGLVAEGLRERPEIKRMVREMMAASSGRTEGAFKKTGRNLKDKDGGIPLVVKKGDKAMEDIQSVSLHQENPDGSFATDSNGNRLPISKALDMQRANIGLEARRIHDRMVEAGYKFQPGEIRWDAEAGKWTEGFFSDQMLKELRKSGIYNSVQMRQVTMASNAIKKRLGTRFSVIQQPSIETINGKKNYAGRPMTLTEVSPYAMTITSKNNIITRNLDVGKVAENIDKLAGNKTGKRLFNGDKERIKKVIGDVMEIQSKGGFSDQYFLDNFGPVEAKNAKNFINSVSGLMSKEQHGYNPDFSLGSKDVAVRTQRMDRTNQMVEIPSENLLPFVHRAWVENRFPSGVPSGQ